MRERHSATESTPQCPLTPLHRGLSLLPLVPRQHPLALFCFFNTTWLFQKAPSQETSYPLSSSLSFPFPPPSLSLSFLFHRAYKRSLARAQASKQATPLSLEWKGRNSSTSLSLPTAGLVGVGRFTRCLVYLLKRAEQPSLPVSKPVSPEEGLDRASRRFITVPPRARVYFVGVTRNSVYNKRDDGSLEYRTRTSEIIQRMARENRSWPVFQNCALSPLIIERAIELLPFCQSLYLRV